MKRHLRSFETAQVYVIYKKLAQQESQTLVGLSFLVFTFNARLF